MLTVMKRLLPIIFLIGLFASCSCGEKVITITRKEPTFVIDIYWPQNNHLITNVINGNHCINQLQKGKQCYCCHNINTQRYELFCTNGADSLSLKIPDYYFYSNLDTLKIVVVDSKDSNHLYVYKEAGWIFRNKVLMGQGPYNEDCHLEATRPISVFVYFVVNFDIPNRNKTYCSPKEYLLDKEMYQLRNALLQL